MGRKHTKEEIISKLKEKNYILISENYGDLRSKVDVMDQDGYLYNIRLDNLINGGKAPERFRRTNKYTIWNLQHYLSSCCSDTLVLSTEYSTAHSLLDFSCGECGKTYSASLNHVVSRKQFRCNECSIVAKGINRRVPQSEVEKEYELSGLKLLDHSSKRSEEKRKCVAQDGRTYMISYRELRQRNSNGYSTYTHSMSRNESMVADYLDYLSIDYEQEYSFEDCRDIQKLRFDFAIFEESEIAFLIEVDGEQHFYPVPFNGESAESARENYERTVKRDKIKTKYCLANNIPLIRIPYYSIYNGEYKSLLHDYITDLQTTAV